SRMYTASTSPPRDRRTTMSEVVPSFWKKPFGYVSITTAVAWSPVVDNPLSHSFSHHVYMRSQSPVSQLYSKYPQRTQHSQTITSGPQGLSSSSPGVTGSTYGAWIWQSSASFE